MADTYDRMTLQSFASKFRQLAAQETRVIHVLERDDIPLGEYGFLELFCADPDCDCRRVMLQVTTPDGRVWASISFGWENARFYRRWRSPCLRRRLDRMESVFSRIAAVWKFHTAHRKSTAVSCQPLLQAMPLCRAKKSAQPRSRRATPSSNEH